MEVYTNKNIPNYDIKYHVYAREDIDDGKLTNHFQLTIYHRLKLNLLGFGRYIFITDIPTYPGVNSCHKLIKSFLKDVVKWDDIVVYISSPVRIGECSTNALLPIKEYLIRNGVFLECNGFRNMNSLFNYSGSIPYIYLNSISRHIIPYIIREEIDQ